MKVDTPIFNLSVTYEPKISEFASTGYAKLCVAILEDAILEWKYLQEYKKDHFETKDTKNAEKDLLCFFHSNWCQLLLSVSAPNISYEFLCEKLKIPAREKVAK